MVSKTVNWIYAITNIALWRYTITIHGIGSPPLQFYTSLKYTTACLFDAFIMFFRQNCPRPPPPYLPLLFWTSWPRKSVQGSRRRLCTHAPRAWTRTPKLSDHLAADHSWRARSNPTGSSSISALSCPSRIASWPWSPTSSASSSYPCARAARPSGRLAGVRQGERRGDALGGGGLGRQ
jgi:hypothetical protein